MARRATSLGPKPSSFIFLCFVFWYFCFFWGFKGQVRWPFGPPHLALNPPYLFFYLFFCLFVFFFFVFFCFFSCFFFPFFASEWKETSFPPKTRHFLFIFECLPLSLLSLFWPSTCSISFSVSLLFFPFFLPSCLSCFAFFWFLLFLSFFFCLLCFCFMKTNNIFQLQSFFSSILCLFLVSCLVFSFRSLFLIFVFPGIQLCFLFNIKVFGFKKNTSWKTPILGQKGSCNKTGFLITCVLQNVKSYRFFFAPFLAKSWLMFKKHFKNTYFSTFSKAKKEKMTILKGYYLGQVKVIIWAKFVAT